MEISMRNLYQPQRKAKRPSPVESILRDADSPGLDRK